MKTTRKTILVIIIVLLGVTSIAQNQFKIIGTIQGLQPGTKVFLLLPNSLGKMDTLSNLSNEGHFEFEGKIANNPDFAYVQIGSVPDYEFLSESLVLFLDANKIEVKGNFTEWPKVKVSGSKANKDFADYQLQFQHILEPIEIVEDIGKKAVELGLYLHSRGQPVSLIKDYSKIKDSLRSTKDYFFWSEYYRFFRENGKYRQTHRIPTSMEIDSLKFRFIKSHPNSLMSPFLLLIPSNKELFRRTAYVMFNPSKYYVPNLLSHRSEIYLIRKSNNELYELYDGLSIEVKSSYYGKYLKHRLDSLPNPNRKQFQFGN